MEKTDRQKRIDLFSNAYSGMGGKKDPLNLFSFSSGTPLVQTDLEMLYQYDWVSRRVIDLYADDSVRKWITVNFENDQDKKIQTWLNSRFEELHIRSKVNELIKLGRLYGAAIMVLSPLDYGVIDQPLNEKNIQDITSLNIIDRYQLNILRKYFDPLKSNYNQPELYSLRLLDGQSIPAIHESRVVKFEGVYLPERLKIVNQRWFNSELQPIYEELKRFGVSMQTGAMLFHDFITKILKIPGLKDLLSTTDGRLAVEARLNYAITGMSNAGIVVCEADEEFSKIQTPITGLVELVKIYIETMSAAAKIPATILFGQSLGVLAGATETTRSWYDMVAEYQEEKVRPVIERVIKLFLLSKNSITKGIEPENWSFKFNPLWQQTDQEKIATRKTQAEIDQIYIDRGVYSAETVSSSRFAGEYSFETVVDLEEMKALEENERDMEILRLNEELESLKQKVVTKNGL